ncbi:MAG: polysaccharide biosynthesis/export family protein [Nitrospirae bacterium]|nr:polysaccharide biosynthesis/export family protein [Nitrospirota bacterium]
MKKITCICVITLLLGFFSAAAYAEHDYIIGPDDVIRVTVYNHPDLAATDRISGEGVIMLPLIGDVKLSGLSVEQAAKKISLLLSDGYIMDPKVSVFVVEFRSKKVMIMGQVFRPGVLTLSGSTTFLELLTLAGGLTKEAGDKATIKRKSADAGKEGEGLITIDLRRLIEQGDASLDVTLMDNDSIYISKAGVFYITGEIKKPDAYRHEEGLTVIKAATMAGGFSDKAAPGRIKIIRKVDKKEKVIERTGMDELVLPDDIIIVPESFF